MAEIAEVHSIENLSKWDTNTIVDVTFEHITDACTHILRTKCVMPQSVNTYDEVAEELHKNLAQWVESIISKEEVEL